MPGSVKHGKDQIKEFIDKQSDINLILDIGAGSATYPRLLGDSYKYIAIEVFEAYINKFNLKNFYQEIIIADASQVELPHADCIIFGDVLEHIEKQTALDLLIKSLLKFKHVVVSIPIGHYPAKIHYNNEKEAHISEWSFKELENLAEWKIKIVIKDIGIFCK